MKKILSVLIAVFFIFCGFSVMSFCEDETSFANELTDINDFDIAGNLKETETGKDINTDFSEENIPEDTFDEVDLPENTDFDFTEKATLENLLKKPLFVILLFFIALSGFLFMPLLILLIVLIVLNKKTKKQIEQIKMYNGEETADE